MKAITTDGVKSVELNGNDLKVVKYRAEVTGMKENVWSNNAMEYDTPEQAQEWLDGLRSRWFGYDMARVVTTDTPMRQLVQDTDILYQNFRR